MGKEFTITEEEWEEFENDLYDTIMDNITKEFGLSEKKDDVTGYCSNMIDKVFQKMFTDFQFKHDKSSPKEVQGG